MSDAPIGPQPGDLLGGGDDRIRRQPADPAELRRYPPRDALCAAMRDRLRDYCDEDLPARERAGLEEHVHTCRECALALARAERERLLVGRAFDEDRAELVMPEDAFTRRVMAEVSAIVLADHEAPEQFTGQVMERVRLEWGHVPLWRRAWLRLGPARAAVLVVGLIGLGVVLGRLSGVDPEVPAVRLEIVRAERATIVPAESAAVRASRPAVPGAWLAPGEILRCEPDGEVVIHRHEPGGGRDTAQIRLFGGGVLRGVSGAELVLVDGAVRVTTPAAWSLGVADSSRVAFPVGGRYDVSAAAVRRFDGAIAGRALRLRVEVADGHAEVRRGGLAPVRVESGKVAHVCGIDVLLEDAPTFDFLARAVPPLQGSSGDRTPSGDPVATAWSGRIVDSTSGRGIGRARVELLSGAVRVGPLTTDAGGWFRFAFDGTVDPYVTARVIPPLDSETDYAAFGPQPIALVPDQRNQRAITIALSADVALRGVVTSATGVAMPGARITACVVDEVFALVDRLEDRAAISGLDGSFVLRGMPANLDSHQSLAVLVEADGAPRVARTVRRGTAGGDELRIVVPRTRTIVLAQQPAHTLLRVLREIPGLPLSAVSDAFDVAVRADGSAELADVGPGELWLCGAAPAGELRRLVPGTGGALVAAATVASERITRQTRRLWSLPQRVDLARGPVAMFAAGNRFGSSAAVGFSASIPSLIVRQVARLPDPSTRVFVELASGEVAFVGTWDGMSLLCFDAPSERPFRLFAVAPDGSLGTLESAAFDGGENTLEMVSPGAATVTAELGDAVGACVFELLDGPFAGQRFWRAIDPSAGLRIDGLVPGTYRVTLADGRTGACTVPPGGEGRVTPVARDDEKR